jgi:2-phospho-L-lactate/phosphoenolpyruvate guanylyltransferase
VSGGVEAIVIPVKQLGRAKLRLSEKLRPADRRRLNLAMLADVLRATEKWPSRLIVTEDPDAEAVGLAFGCTLASDPGSGLNDALVAGTSAAVELGATTVLILPSDVPLVSPDDLAELFAYPEDVVIVSSRDGGTNALVRRPPDAIWPLFGPCSAEAHRRAAERAGLGCRVVELGSLRLDVDRYSDLVELGRTLAERESVRLAAELVGG